MNLEPTDWRYAQAKSSWFDIPEIFRWYRTAHCASRREGRGRNRCRSEFHNQPDLSAFRRDEPSPFSAWRTATVRVWSKPLDIGGTRADGDHWLPNSGPMALRRCIGSL